MTGTPHVAGAARLRDWASLIKLSHSVFALPFALIALLAASAGAPEPRTLALVVAAVVCARTAAMAYNRYVDRAIDADNPRTAGRELPRGVIRPRAALALAAVAAVAFAACAWALSPLCLLLSPVVLLILLGYSWGKRFTDWTHLWLGVALGLAAPAAWVAVRGVVDSSLLAPLVLGCGVALWVAGFDVLYACQDLAFDARRGLRSLPVRLGLPRALVVSRSMHLAAVVLFAGFGAAVGFGLPWAAGVAAAAAFLLVEHRLLAGGDLARIDTAFFTMNGLVSVALLGAAVLEYYP